MKIVEIKNLDGEVIFSYDEEDEKWIWGDYDFSGVNLEKANLEGIVWQQISLRRANLKEADCYRAILCGSDLSESDCESAEFTGANLKQVNFTKASLKNAVFTKDNLGGSTDVSGANFNGAVLDGAEFKETFYNARTIFPENFNPEKNGLVRIKTPIE
ncbi:MAG TPA: pentapeptide repeat-containing protein [Pyrinomonadaceae bacterium]|jgi:uncharacterized protein YjbI with pentapeptide repeats